MANINLKKAKRVSNVIQTKYYGSFQCMGGDCPDTCCFKWRIFWTVKEVEKLKSAECSEHMKELINTSFEKSDNDPDKMQIIFGEKKSCPFLTEDNFCSIQRELGEEYLSGTCRFYPRNPVVWSDCIIKYCHLSCYAVTDKLCRCEDSAELINTMTKGLIPTMNNEINRLSDYPVLRYHYGLFTFFYDMIADKTRSLETSLILGAVAAKTISDRIEKKQLDSLPDLLTALKKQLNNPAQIEKLENIKPNIQIKLGFGIRLFNTISQSIIPMWLFDETKTINIDKYETGMRFFNESFANEPFAIRNIALNLLMELNMPFWNYDISLYDNYCYYIAAISAVKIIAAAVAFSGFEIKKGFNISVAVVDRNLCHNTEKINEVLSLLKEYNCTSPAHLAYLLK